MLVFLRALFIFIYLINVVLVVGHVRVRVICLIICVYFYGVV